MYWLDKICLQHINFETLGILFCLMAVAAGLERLGYIDLAARKLCEAAGSLRSLILMLVLLCFFVSMLVTNDVSLIVFVPFTIELLAKINESKRLIRVIVLETIAANMGSMVTPFGNPQNVYLYRQYGMKPEEFFRAILPYAIISLLLLVVLIKFDKSTKVKVDYVSENVMDHVKYGKMQKTVMYVLLFVVSIAAVIGLIPWWMVWLGVTGSILVTGLVDYLLLNRDGLPAKNTEWRVLKGLNYGLLTKFILLFVLVGNVAAIPAVSNLLSQVVSGNEVFAGLLLSQVISNVPAAVMLSKFTTNGIGLMVGCNIGGLGTLIASMASMISLEYYGLAKEANKKNYILTFTGYNLLFLLAMLLCYFIL